MKKLPWLNPKQWTPQPKCPVTGKVTYKDFRRAKWFAERLGSLPGRGTLQPYTCQWCGRIHIGHRKQEAKGADS